MTGIGLVVYPVLWLVMPKAGAFAGSAPLLTQDTDAWRRRANEFGQEISQAGQQIGHEMRQAGQQIREVFLREQAQSSQAPTVAEEAPPQVYNFDPLTGQPVHTSAPTTGQTINLRVDPTLVENDLPPAEASNPLQQPIYYAPPAPTARPKHRGRSMGIVLMAVGALILAGQFDIAQYVFPILMIGAGILLLRRR